MNLRAAALVLMALGPAPAAIEDERPGPPILQRTSRGTSGPFTYDVFAEEYRKSDALSARRQPYHGIYYYTMPFRYSLMQGQAVYTYHDRPLHLIHNYTCEKPDGNAEIPWTCRAFVFVMKGSQPWRHVPEGNRPKALEEDGIAMIAETEATDVEGAFEEIAPHPSRPLFLGINHGCCDSPSRVSVHDFDGRLVCPTADLYLGDVETGPWDKLPIEGGALRCPGGQRVKVPSSLLDEATAQIRLHAGPLWARYRLPEASDAREDWKRYAGSHGHPPVFAFGDYNDDGFPDLAFLLPLRKPSRAGVGFGVFCLLSQDADSFRLVTVAEPDPFSLLPVHGLAVVRPGPHPTDAIRLYAFESTAALYVWNAEQGRFRRIPLAD